MADDRRDDDQAPPRPRRALPARAGSHGGEAGGLVRYDPLRAYMAEVQRHPLLSTEEEHALAVRYRETGDVDAAYRLVASNLRLVVKIAHEYRRTAFQLLDLVQEGNMGLMQAVKKYDPWKGVKLSSYAAWWIRAYIIRFIMENWRMVKLGTTQAQRKLFFNLSKEREKLLARGIEPTPRLLARNLQVEVKDVEEMSARMGSE
ncbi:MAG TPA: sigma-70 family RNA polymerase sigma factor, partial [Thermoanaerobaculia bacterium]|nr:sigma-70 family RNA polymerase sigma factor [Thermoanaerobaculia bacterium]